MDQVLKVKQQSEQASDPREEKRLKRKPMSMFKGEGLCVQQKFPIVFLI